jgi:DNA-binding GntR family transcriptional regulator
MKTVAARKTKGLSEQAFDQIKQDIVWCKFAPGEAISEAELANIYGLGKAPIRHALSRLIQEGYVNVIPRSGHIIAPVTLQSVKEIFEFRLIIEPEVMELACGKIDPAKLRALDARCALGYTPGDRASEARFMEANHRFHMEIARCCGNSRLAATLSQIIHEMTRLLHLGFVMRERPEEMRGEHTALIDALANNEKKLARHITAVHIETIRKLVISGIMSHTNLGNTNISPI